VGSSGYFRRTFSVVISSMRWCFQTWKYSLVEIDKWLEMKDLNGLSYKVVGLPQTASGQQRQNFLGVLPDHISKARHSASSRVRPPSNSLMDARSSKASRRLLSSLETRSATTSLVGGHGISFRGEKKTTSWVACGGE
jgi:hypothetical protein